MTFKHLALISGELMVYCPVCARYAHVEQIARCFKLRRIIAADPANTIVVPNPCWGGCGCKSVHNGEEHGNM